MAVDVNVSNNNSLLNLTALQRLDSSITSIVESANQVCIYRFLPEPVGWQKTEIEGTLFIFMRTKYPQYGFIVMNRNSTTNLIESITSSFQYQLQNPFILYCNIQNKINSIWFYEEDSLLKIGKVFSSLTHSTITRSDKLSNIKTTTGSSDEKLQEKGPNNLINMDIMSLLSRAQEEYDKKLSHSPSKLQTEEFPSGKILKPTPVRATNGVVFSNNASVPLTIDSLFAQVGDGKHVFNGEANQNEKLLSRSKSLSEAGRALKFENNEGVLQKLLSRSNQTVKKIENGVKIPPGRQIRARSATVSNCAGASVEMVEKDLKEKLNILPKGDQVVNESPKTLTDSILLNYAPSKPKKILEPEIEDVLTPAMLSSSLPNSYSSPFNLHQSICENNSSLLQSTLPMPPLHKKHSPVPLLSPMDFTNSVSTSRLKGVPSPPKINASLGSRNTLYDDDSLKEEILLPQTLIHSSTSKSMNVTPLTKAQLREALIYMCQHDDEFVSQLHECYLKSLKCQLNHFRSS